MAVPIVRDVADFDVVGRQMRMDGEPRFILMDTAWAIVGDVTDDELSYYFDTRGRQGFNAIGFGVLPIPHDRVRRRVAIPFNEELLLERGSWHLDERYFQRLASVLEVCARRRVMLFPIALHANYVHDTQFARRDRSKYVMPQEVRAEYLAMLSAALLPVLPSVLVLVSGDTSFHSDAEVDEWIGVSHSLQEMLPGARLAYHMAPHAFLPDSLLEFADVFTYQGGHQAGGGDLNVDLAVRYSALERRRPVMNVEPPYEAHRLVRGAGSFGRREVRRAIWKSVVAGASSGAGYGHLAIFPWARSHSEEWTTEGLSGRLLDWRDGIHSPGAIDAAFVRQVIDEVGCVGASFSEVRPTAPLAAGWDPGVCSLSIDGTIGALYLPYGGPVDLNRCGLGDRAPSKVQAFDLEARSTLAADVVGLPDGELRLELPHAREDAVVFLWFDE